MTREKHEQAAQAVNQLFNHIMDFDPNTTDEKLKMAYTLGYIKQSYIDLLAKCNHELFTNEIDFINCVTKK